MGDIESRGYSVAYSTFFFHSAINFPTDSPNLDKVLYYNAATEEYLIMSMQQEGASAYEPLQSRTELLRATRLGNELNLYVYHKGQYHEYSGYGVTSFQGEFKNTYRNHNGQYYWVSCVSSEEKLPEPITERKLRKLLSNG